MFDENPMMTKRFRREARAALDALLDGLDPRTTELTLQLEMRDAGPLPSTFELVVTPLRTRKLFTRATPSKSLSDNALWLDDFLKGSADA